MNSWLYALASVDLGLMYESQYTVDAFRDAIMENNTVDLKMAYINLTGSIPSVIAELIQTKQDEERRVDVGAHVAMLRYNHKRIVAHPVHCYQIKRLVDDIIDSDPVPSEHHRKTYIQTRKRLMQEGIDARKASAYAFRIHNTDSPAQPTDVDEVTLVQDMLDTNLPNAYLGVDSRGCLHVIDSTQGTYTIPTSPPLPSQWLCRVSDLNEFICGDEHRCVHLCLSDGLDAVLQTPLTLQNYPSDVICVDYTWIAWGTKKRPFAIKWSGGYAVECSTEDARKFVVSSTKLEHEGGRILFKGNPVSCLPVGHSVSCLYGDTSSVDVITTSSDFWRIDLRNNRATCVGLPGKVVVVAISPLVGWM